MPTYKVELKRREEVAEGTMAFYFEKPAGFQLKAGQFANYTPISPPEDLGLPTQSCCPEESQACHHPRIGRRVGA